ncbi:hypothetical protein BC941DRAFT_426447 [Chlamydoabsidia padenii]|nr:hypothetical protein BC941DRAFT_426447 [Chlamydoabsidia padenii]
MTLVGPINDVMRLVAVPPKDGQWMALTTMLRRQSIKVDLVTDQEKVWVKVIARNIKAFRHEIAGLEWDNYDDGSDDDNEFGYSDSDDDDVVGAWSFDELPIFKKAQTYLDCARTHLVHYKTPVVVFAFMRIQYDQDPFVQRIMDRLEEMGICVYLLNHRQQGMTIQTRYLPFIQQVFGDNHSTTPQLNLDVSTVLAMVSQLSHHGCSVDEIDGEALKTQAQQQVTTPILPILDQILSNKQLYIVQSAFDRLQSIMDVVAGPMEIKRYHYLFPHLVEHSQTTTTTDSDNLWTSLTTPPIITIVPDQPSPRFQQLLELPPPAARGSKLNNGKKIRSRFSPFHAGIFGTADTLKMTTVTAIQWMPAALVEAGLLGSAIVTHPPRSLAEQKMHIKEKVDN